MSKLVRDTWYVCVDLTGSWTVARKLWFDILTR